MRQGASGAANGRCISHFQFFPSPTTLHTLAHFVPCYCNFYSLRYFQKCIEYVVARLHCHSFTRTFLLDVFREQSDRSHQHPFADSIPRHGCNRSSFSPALVLPPSWRGVRLFASSLLNNQMTSKSTSIDKSTHSLNSGFAG